MTYLLLHSKGLWTVQRHQDSYMRRELQWEATLERLKQQLAQLKGEGSQKAAEDTAEGQARQLSTIRYLNGLTAAVPISHLAIAVNARISRTGHLSLDAPPCPHWLSWLQIFLQTVTLT